MTQRGDTRRLELLEAVAQGNLTKVEELLAVGCDPNASHPRYGNTPLSSACFTNRPEIIKRLLQSGADPNLRITYRSPVDGRVEKGVVALMFSRSLEAVTALLEAGADPSVHAEEGTTPLMRAVLASPPAAVEALLAAGADASARNTNGDTAADLVRRRLEWLRSSQASEGAKGRRRVAALEHMLAILSAAV
jgi:ankyrin repeat protein